MWILGIVIAATLILIAGMAKGMANRILFHQETLPIWMHTSFWLFYGTKRPDGDYAIFPGRFGRFKDFTREKGQKFIGSTNIFIGATSGFHAMEFLHAFLLSAGSVMLAISVFFYAHTVSGFVRWESSTLFATYFFRCIGKELTYRNGSRQFFGIKY